MDQQDQKREQIIDAALKRFAHFGLNKTTMNEIAGDLNFSKALLYYYFPDKLSLYAAVLEQVFAEITEVIDKALQDAKTPESAIKIYIEARKSFLEKYFPILDFNKFLNAEKYQVLKKLLNKSNESEIGHIKNIIQIGINAGNYQVKDIEYIAKLLFDAILGVRIIYINTAQVQFGIDKDFLNMISNRQKDIMSIFLKGLEK
ncbi:TetR/AcrR family transcriptional regulator [Pedobacter arcticus]|uniref:TetR/AcrR family transcriptional regulator n=1 Tax=Pedobacter arcticus TaxID=752140 RepID=UPI0002EC7763|nr:TetR/AcrR family transcriptional regulator [Pedobacter arcticus]